jgi:hypothetical protein
MSLILGDGTDALSVARWFGAQLQWPATVALFAPRRSGSPSSLIRARRMLSFHVNSAYRAKR